MTLTTNQKKRNPKTGKLENTGVKETIGRVDRGSKGGSSLGVTNGLQPTGKQIGGKPVYGAPRAPKGGTGAVSAFTVQNPGNVQASIVPNFTPAQQPIPASFEYNTSTPNGPVYTPPPAAPPPAPSSNVSSGIASPDRTGSQGGGAQYPPQRTGAAAPAPQLQTVQLPNAQGGVDAYQVDPTQSFISQTGRYQYDFWTKEGQAERLQNALETVGFRGTGTQFTGGEGDPTALPGATAAINALNAAAVVYGGAKIFTSLAGMSKVGALAATPAGVQTLASTTTTAATAANTAKTVAGVASNPGTVANSINAVKALLSGNKLITLGAVLTAAKLTSSGIESTDKDKTAFTQESGALQQKLLDAGMYDMARELYETNKDIRTGFDQIIPYIPIFGDTIVKRQIQQGRDELYAAELAYEKYERRAMEQAKEEAQQKAAEEEVAQREDQQAFQQQQQEDTQAFQTSEREARQAFETQQMNAAAAEQERLDATATQDSGSSTLTFGLLGTGGSTEFVDKDRAARYYFSKPYEELTAAQKALMNLLKGGN